MRSQPYRPLCLLLLSLSLSLLLLLPIARGTIVAARCAGGVVIGTDGLDVQGPLVGNRHQEKVVRVNPLTVVCLAKHNADVRNLCKELRRVSVMHEAHCGETLGTSSIAHIARRLVHDRFPEAHVLVVGGESVQPPLSAPFSIHEVLPGGTRIEQEVAVAGSGSHTIITLINELWGGDEGGQTVRKQQVAAADDPSVTASRIKRAMDAAIRSDPQSGGDVSLWLVSRSSLNVELKKM